MGLLQNQWGLVQSRRERCPKHEDASVPEIRRLIYPGNGRHGAHRRHFNRARRPPLHHPNRRRHRRRIYRPSPVPRRPCRFNRTWRRNDNRSGCDYRAGPDGATRLHYFHARGGKTSRQLHCASRNRLEPLHRRARRYVSLLFYLPNPGYFHLFLSIPKPIFLDQKTQT